MSLEYPDVLGDLVDARQRFEVNGLHYLLALQPATVAPGEATALHAWLQSCWDVPLVASIAVHLPARSAAGLSLAQTTTEVPLEPAEVGEVRIPIATDAALEPGEYLLSVTMGASFETRGHYLRGQENEGQLGDTLLSFTSGMGLSATLGLGFVAHSQPQRDLPLHVSGAPQPGPAPDLTPTYLPHWTVEDMNLQARALRFVNDRRLYLLPKITRQALYMAFLEESQERLREAGLPLHMGEALFLAKILTFSVEYFFKRADWQDAILVPAFGLAFRYDLPADDPVLLICRADYARMARLAISLSFGLLHLRLQRDLWTREEQVAVADLVADRVERGGLLPVEFLYLPLLLGGVLVAGEVQMPGEKPAQSLALLGQAYHKRTADLAENPELVALFQKLLTSRPAH
ncbi:MAG: hypothetical protein P8129_13920 [Anaerolineae bacterium]|jgi:hypothetical protein